jgi:hypothetical protein
MIAILATEGVFNDRDEPVLLQRVHDALAAAIDATDDEEVSALIGVTLQVLPKARFIMGRVPASAVRIDVAVPSVALSSFRRRRQFVREATAAVVELSTDPTIASRVIVRIHHLVDGGWGTAGQMITNDDIDDPEPAIVSKG